mgnify:CR=1 FL=1
MLCAKPTPVAPVAEIPIPVQIFFWNIFRALFHRCILSTFELFEFQSRIELNLSLRRSEISGTVISSNESRRIEYNPSLLINLKFSLKNYYFNTNCV